MTIKSKSKSIAAAAAVTADSSVSAAPSSTRSNKSADEGDEEEGEYVCQPDNEEQNDAPIRLYKSTRLKGYITLLLASAINYSSAAQSDSTILSSTVPATQKQKNFAMAVAVVTMIVSLSLVIVHIDCSPLRKYWSKAFQPNSKIELGTILFLVIWWVVATWIQTSVEGIAGTGKGQYNLYFSTWACCWTSIWTLERWIVAAGMLSFKDFLAEWPNRAPSWIATLILSFCTLLTFIDLYLNWENDGSPALKEQLSKVGKSQWEWLFFVASITIPCSLGFVIVEIFREQGPEGDQNNKSHWETILEGVLIVLLVLGWLPSVMVATTPGGIASLVGNAYFFIWATTVFVMETFVWWLHDWRKRIHLLLQHEQEEYEKIQEKVLEKSEAVLAQDKEEEDLSVTQPDASNKESTIEESIVEEQEEDEEELTTYSERIPDSIGA